MLLSKYNITPRIRKQPPSEIQFNQHEERLIMGFPSRPSTVSAFKNIFQKLSSNGLDFVELELKPIGHR